MHVLPKSDNHINFPRFKFNYLIERRLEGLGARYVAAGCGDVAAGCGDVAAGCGNVAG